MGPEIGLRDINTEIATKMVPMRAVDLSIGPFCTEFRCEQLCDDDIFRGRGPRDRAPREGVNFWAPKQGSKTETKKLSRKWSP